MIKWLLSRREPIYSTVAAGRCERLRGMCGAPQTPRGVRDKAGEAGCASGGDGATMTKSSGGDSKNTLYCSFCGKSQHEVRKLIAGPTVFICDECVELC